MDEKREKDGVAYASFDNGGDVKKISGLIRFPQISKETTSIAGIFSAGFISENKNDYGFVIIDACDNLLFDTDDIRDQLYINLPGTGAFEFDKKLQVKYLTNSFFIVKFNSKEIGRAPIKRTNCTILISNEIDIMNDPLEETITNVKSINSEIETTKNNNSLEETESNNNVHISTNKEIEDTINYGEVKNTTRNTTFLENWQ
ncbi:1132_t:CDS:2, partial [Entrophospora sp. SA101]